jgi:predicted transcriptional regulator
MGELERAVMERLWSEESGSESQSPFESWLTVREVYDGLASERDIAYTTVMTVLDRLAKKGLVSQERDGRAYRYRSVASRDAMAAESMRAALDEFATGDRHTALVRFVGEATREERNALREALAGIDEP